MKAVRLLFLFACCFAVTAANAQGRFKEVSAAAVYQYAAPAQMQPRPVYVVPAVCPYPYGCDVYGNPYPAPYMNSQPYYGAAMLPVSLAVQAISGGRHGGVSVAASVLPGALGIIGNLFLNVRR